MGEIENRIKLDRFTLREYQLPILDALENKSYKKILYVLPRRSGKDILAFNVVIRQALKRVGIYYYIFPTYSQGKKALFDAITISGVKFIDYIPRELIASCNSQEMKITLINNSIIQVLGSTDYDRVRGTNPVGVVFSEFATQDPTAFSVLRPVLIANNGWFIIESTPNGENHFYDMYQIAKNSDDWFSYFLTVDDTQHISIEEIEKDIRDGVMSRDMAQQEYWCSFSIGATGSYYAKYINQMRLDNRIGDYPWESSFKVSTSWDLGMSDATIIVFYQVIQSSIRIIDCVEGTGKGLEAYAKILESKPYQYNRHFAPHDIKVRELGTGMSRLEKAKRLGIKFTLAPDLSIEDGREAVRSLFSKLRIDAVKCEKFIKAVKLYRKEYDTKKKRYKDQHLHDWTSDWADALRYLAISLPKVRDGLTSEDIDKNYREAKYGNQSNLPGFFRDDYPKY